MLNLAYGRPPIARVSVLVVNSQRDLRELLPQFWERPGAKPIGGYWSGPFGHHIVIRADAEPRERVRRLLHEYGHFLTHVALNKTPPWLDEGLSELWTNATFNRNGVEFGRPVSEHLKRLKSGPDWIPVSTLVTAPALPPASDRDALARFYAESWALVHYLVFERGGGRLPFQDRLSEALPPDDVLQRYINQPRLPVNHVPLSPTAAASSCGGGPREMDLLEAQIARAEALADGERPTAALPILREAETIAPDNPQIAEINGVIRFIGNDAVGAAAVFDRLIAAGVASHISYYYRALLAATPGPTAGTVPVAEYLRHALNLEPGFSPARERLKALDEQP